ncbi:MAG: cell wall hydrolase [Rhodospirillales bacterium]|nr:cell wall hydrolase [Rhodospirillales bacterium]
MGRSVVTTVTGAVIGALFWAAALLLPPISQAHAQAAAIGTHGAAAMVREAVLADGTTDQELECLARNVYFEARGEPMTGKYAVAAVTLNRVVDVNFPSTICQVVYQGVGLGANMCQFSWACDRYSDRPRDAKSWELAKQVAYNALFLDRPDPTGGALYFHTTRVRPTWSRTMVKVGIIGAHVFYRQRGAAAVEIAEVAPGEE